MAIKPKKQKDKKARHYMKNYNAILYWVSIMALLFVILIINPIAAGKLMSNAGKINSITLQYILWAITAFLSLLFSAMLIFPNKLSAHFKSNWLNYMLLSIVLLMILIFAEIGLRTISHSTSQKKFNVSNYEYNYSISINTDGFRDDEFIKQKNINTFRILLIGNSFIYGDGVEQNQTLDYYMEQILRHNADNKLDYDVYNLGVSGAGLREYYALAKKFKQYNPDLVIVVLYVDNNIQKDTSAFSRLLRKSKLFTLIENINLKTGNCTYNWIGQYHIGSFYKELACNGMINPWLLSRGALGENQNYYDKLTERFENDNYVKNNLLKIKMLYPDLPFLLVIQPSSFQVSARYIKSLEKVGYVFSQDKVVDRKLQDSIIRWAADNGIAYLDLLQYLKEDEDVSYFYPIDGHLVPEGNYLVADKISKAITS
ncbi:SGNH/GDSL hydrolase family protein [Candidatus Woesearchaeota archaeon]|nr:SGNH/GDSL hydrolase family protein [Candidatus Woesearchaeota archaeon]